jgi:hypothetical protein
LAANASANDLRTRDAPGHGIETRMVGINTGVVSDSAAPFGGVKSPDWTRWLRFGYREYLETYTRCPCDPTVLKLCRARSIFGAHCLSFLVGPPCYDCADDSRTWSMRARGC